MSRGSVHRIPLVPDPRVALVEATFGGNLKRRLLVDTGSLVTSMSSQTARTLGADLQHPAGWLDLTGVEGERRRIPVVNPGRLAIGNVIIPIRQIAVLDLPPIFRADGLLGLDVLRDFRMTLEFDTGHLVLRPTALVR